MGYCGNIVGKFAYGSEYNQDYTNSLWNVSAPFDSAVSLQNTYFLTFD